MKPGDTIRTGRNGRVLLKRGEETILISPNSVVGVPAEKKEGLSTTIVQQAGSILLEVEKRNVKHFEVETPYLAAVVKGTQFRVTVERRQNQRRRDPRPGRGCRLQVGPDRAGDAGPARDGFRQRQDGLSLGGTGTFSPIEQGTAARAFDRARAGAARRPLRAAQARPTDTSAPIVTACAARSSPGMALPASRRRSAKSG